MYKNGQCNNIEEVAIRKVILVTFQVTADILVENISDKANKHDKADNPYLNQILQEEVMRLAACVRVILIMFVK
ncbi:hypothetical protein D3C81_2129300 [compost metagenome]